MPDHDDEAPDGHAFPPPAEVRGAVTPGQQQEAQQAHHQQQAPHHQPPHQQPPPQQLQQPRPEPGRGTKPPRTPPEPPAPGDRRAIAQYLLLVLAAVVATTLRLPWTVAALLLAVAAIVVGIRMMRSSRGTPRAAFNPLIVASLAMSGFVLLTSGATIALWPAQSALQECEDRAVTVTAQARCQAEFSDAVTGMFTPGG